MLHSCLATSKNFYLDPGTAACAGLMLRRYVLGWVRVGKRDARCPAVRSRLQP